MAEETHTKKRHKTSDSHAQHNIPQGSPIGEDLDPLFPNPIGEEELKQDGNTNEDSGVESFKDTDACKTLDDLLGLITIKLPEFQHIHSLVSAKLLGEVDKIDDPQEKNKLINTSGFPLRTSYPN